MWGRSYVFMCICIIGTVRTVYFPYNRTGEKLSVQTSDGKVDPCDLCKVLYLR